MSWMVIALAALLLVELNKIWAPWALKGLQFRGECDRIMAERGQSVTWKGTVENRSWLPIPFVRLREIFPGNAQPEMDKRWIRTHCTQGIQQWSVEEKMTLGPRQTCSRTLQLSFGGRGVYTVGNYRLATGDLLGLEEAGMEGPGASIVVIPDRAKSEASVQALGGFLGDISVRRFILEDPILTVGFRDYTGREPMKAISWTRSAMTGNLQVKQFDHTAEQTVMILLNVEGGTPETWEACFRLMRSTCETLEKKKIPFGLRTNGNLPGPVGKVFYMAEGLGGNHLDTILYALGRADYLSFYSLQYLVTQTLQHRKNNEAYILITPKVDGQVRGLLRKLETAVGNPVCVLSGETEAAS